MVLVSGTKTHRFSLPVCLAGSRLKGVCQERRPGQLAVKHYTDGIINRAFNNASTIAKITMEQSVKLS